MHPIHIITGGTGFVGSAIILELLRNTDARIVGLVRPGMAGAELRLRKTIEHVARLYGLGDSLDKEIARRCEGVPADLGQPLCGVTARPEWAGAQMWHCAASLQYLDRYAQQIFATNVDGTKTIVDLAEAAQIHTLNTVSTSYVAGTRSGLILEAPVESLESLGTNNHYERSKVMAEAVARAAALPRVRVLRPSIVIGHSEHLTALNFNGLYGFLRSIYRFRRLIARTKTQVGGRLELRMVADPEATLNLIPVDIVAADAVALALAEADAGVYHLVTAEPPQTCRALEVMFEAAGVQPPTYVSSRDEFTPLDEKFNAKIDFYTAYLVGPKRFSRRRIDRYVPDSRAASFKLPPDELRRFCAWYIDRLVTKAPPSVTR